VLVPLRNLGKGRTANGAGVGGRRFVGVRTFLRPLRLAIIPFSFGWSFACGWSFRVCQRGSFAGHAIRRSGSGHLGWSS